MQHLPPPQISSDRVRGKQESLGSAHTTVDLLLGNRANEPEVLALSQWLAPTPCKMEAEETRRCAVEEL